MTYTHTSFSTAKSALATLLGDPDKTHWLDDELGMYLTETIRLFNSLTALHRSVDSFPTSTSTPFYDLSSVLPSQELSYTLTDLTLISLTQYQLMEPSTPTVWTGSEMWVLSELISALQRRRDLFLFDTGIRLTSHPIVTSTPDIDLPEEVMSVRRAVWITPEGHYYQLWPSDDTLSLSTRADLNPTGIPTTYSISSVSSSRVRLSPSPLSTGTLDLLTVDAGATLDPSANAGLGTPIGIPNDLAWGVRFGAMADLLSKDGPARDPVRAALCEDLYQLSVQIARALPSVLGIYVTSRRLPPSTTLAKLDGLYPGWQGRTPDTPTKSALASPHLLALSPLPDAAYPITVEYARNAIIPVGADDHLQVAREDLDAIYSWAQFLASFKSQGTSLQSAHAHAHLLFSRALAYNESRILQSTHLSTLMGLASDERRDRPYYRTPTAEESESDRSDRPDTASSHQTRDRLISNRRLKRLGGR